MAMLVLFLFMMGIAKSQILIEAESFEYKGGWVTDPQFMDQMGSPYLMAHGLGEPVESAKTRVVLPSQGRYKVWVRTFNWIAPWYTESDGPGAFQLSINGHLLPTALGTKGVSWTWQEAGIIDIKKEKDSKEQQVTAEVELIDLTGFNGRVDAVFFTEEMDYMPPNDKKGLAELRKNLQQKQIHKQHFDLVVVGGGLAGCTAALSATRLGLKVALINNRPVLGGNNSSEIRVGLSGKINANYYPKIGNILRELTGIPIPEDSHKEAGVLHPPRREASNELDDFREYVLRNEPNLSLFLNIHVNEVEMDANSIVSVSGEDIETGKTYLFQALYFLIVQVMDQ